MKTIHKLLGGFWMLICGYFFVGMAPGLYYEMRFGPISYPYVGLFFPLLYLTGSAAGFCLLFGARWARPVVGAAALLITAANLMDHWRAFYGPDWLGGMVFVLAPLSAAVLLLSHKPVKFMMVSLAGLAMTLVLTEALSQVLDADRVSFLYEFLGLDYETASLLANVVSFGVSTTLVVAFFRWWCKRQNNKKNEMNDARDRCLSTFSLFSLAAPFIAYALCFLVYSRDYPWLWFTPWIGADRFHAEQLTLSFAFLIAVIVGAIVLFADIGFKQWRLVWQPLVGLVFCGCLFVPASWFVARLGQTL